MNAVIDEPLGHVEGPHAATVLQRTGREHKLVHRIAGESQRQFLGADLPQVPGVQDGVLGHLAKPARSQAANVTIGPNQHARLAQESAQAADALFPLADQVEHARRGLLDQRHRQVRLQVGRDGNRPGSRAPAAVRCRERLVGVDVNGVGAPVARAGDAQDGVEVGPVDVEFRPDVVQHTGHLRDVGLEQSQGIRAGQHHAGHRLVELAAKVVQVDQAAVVRTDLLGPKARDPCAGRVGSVGAVGHQDRRSLLAAVAEVGGKKQ